MDDLFDLLPGLLKTFPDSEDVREAVVFAVFRKAAGDGLLRHAVPRYFEGGKLTVSVADQIWERHMRSLAPGIIYRINRMAGKQTVSYIDFQVDESQFEKSNAKKDSQTTEKVNPQECTVPEDLRQKAKAIRDPELRDVFLQSAGVYLAARDKAQRNR